MHPLVLHFPIVLLVLAIVWETDQQGKRNSAFRSIGNTLLLATAFSAALAALMGLWLSNEGGYEPTTLFWHKWSGIATSLLAFAWYVLREWTRVSKVRGIALGTATLTALVIAGHQGATLTHGENYLLAPVTSNERQPQVAQEDALLYRDLVRPILEDKCMTCHNARKAKGELNMETEASLLKGGKNGLLWDKTAAHLGLLMQRIHLPLAEKEHMPPQGKPQLTEEEMQILFHWIKNGADFKQKIVDLPENDTLRLLAAPRFATQVQEHFDFDAADESDIQKLNTDFRVIHPLALHSPALAVDFYNSAAFQSKQLEELKPVREQVVQLNLNKMPVQDEDLTMISDFSNLRKLNLTGTQITGASLSELKNLKFLRQLALSETPVKAANLLALETMPNLSVLYLWNTGVTEVELPDLKQRMPHVRFETGFSGQNVIAKLNPPTIECATEVFTDSTKCLLKTSIKGSVIRYTLDGSIPDSLHSPSSTGDSITISRTAVLTTKTFLSGWISSDVSRRSFYKTGITPDSIAFITTPNPQYKGLGAPTLVDKKIGDTEFRTNKWLGYRETDLECLLFFKRPTTLSSAYVSALANTGSFIMPPAEIQIWGGNDARHLTLLKKLRPEQPNKIDTYRVGYDCTFTPRTLKVLKLVLKPVAKLPFWHPQKGEKGWVFVDEVFLN